MLSFIPNDSLVYSNFNGKSYLYVLLMQGENNIVELTKVFEAGPDTIIIKKTKNKKNIKRIRP